MGRVFGIGILLAGSLAWAQTGGDIAPPKAQAPLFFAETSSYPVQDRSVSKPALEALEKPIDKFVLENVPLDQALEQFMKAAHVNGTVDWKAVEGAGVARHKAVTITLSQVPARRVLGVVLAEVDAGADLHFLVMDNMVMISTREALQSSKYQVVSVYDIRPLFADVEYGSPEGTAIAGNFLNTLMATVETDSWRDNGGSVGSARILNGQLIVNQSVDVQDEVAAFVAQFRGNVTSATRAYDVRDLVKEDIVPAAAGGAPNRMDDLIQTIETSCGRDTWRDRGGKRSSVAAFDGKLYVTTNVAVHQQIEQLLAMMRKKD